MIKPTVGRKVWFIPSPQYVTEQKLAVLTDLNDPLKIQPMDATIIGVHDDSTVNLFVVEPDGFTRYEERVHLIQSEDEDYTVYPYHAMWMPYQVTQAAKDVGGVVIKPPSGIVS